MSLGPEASISDETAIPPTTDAADERIVGEKTIAGRSLRQIAWRRLKRDRVAIGGGLVIIVLIIIAILAPLLIKLLGHPFDQYHNDKIDPTLGTPIGRLGGISKDYLLGVEPVNGRDIFSRIVYGAQTTLTVAFLSAFLSTILGVLFGMTAGFVGGWVDSVVSRVMDFLLAFPQLLFSIALVSVLPDTLFGFSGRWSRVCVLIAVIGFFGWPYIGRIVRGQTLSLREREFVEASRSLGARSPRILFREMLPNLAAPILVYTTLIIPTNILTEAALSFLGVGIPPPFPSWGGMLSDALQFYRYDPMFMIVPGAMIFITVLSFNLFGDGLRDALDPESPLTTFPQFPQRFPLKESRRLRRSPFKEVGVQVVGKTKVIVAATAALTLGLTAACGSSSNNSSSNSSSGSGGAAFNAAATKVVNASDKKGGTLNFWSPQDADSFDPAISYYAWTINMNRLYTRTLMTYAPKPGPDGLISAPDLASAAPTISADGKTYTFKLRSGLKFDDGSPITSKDIKYGIERIFAQDVVPGGPLYLINELDQGQKYPGPYKDSDPNKLGLKTVETPDDSTIVFHLAAPNANFPYELALPGGGPVPQKRDTGAKYALAPASSGPYKFDSIQPGKGATLSRNTNWDASTDPNRKALPDKITLTITTNADDMDARLIAGTADLDASQSGVQTQARTQILRDDKLKSTAYNPNNGFIRYAVLSPKIAPLDNIDCRKAVIYASDPTSLQTARGGPVAGGDIATNMLPPNILGSDSKYDPYGRAQGKPQLDKAKAALQACGQPNGFSTKIAVRNNKPAEVATATALQAALKTVGINATIDQYDGSQVATVVGSPNNVHKKGYGIMISGWGADFPTGYGYLAPLADGSFIAANGNYNLAEINDPTINGLFSKGLAETDAKAAAADYQQANMKVMDGFYFLPFVFDKALNYYNPRLTNVYFHQGLAMVDFASLGVSDGK